MRKTNFTILSTLLMLSSTANAFILEELNLSVNRPSTTITLTNNGSLSLPTDSEKGFTISYSVENFPVIPDTRIEYTHLYTTGSRTLNQTLTLSDYTLEKGTEVSTKVDADNIKLSFYYQPLDKFNYDFVNLELGVNLLFIDYKVKNKYTYNSSWEDTIDISALLPSLHFKVSLSPTYYLSVYARGALPLSGRRRDKEIEGGVKYYLTPQLYLFAAYQYTLNRADNVNGYDFKAKSNSVLLGAGFLW